MLERIKEHSRMITLGACCLVTAVALSYKLTKQREAGVERDFHLARLHLEKLKKGDGDQLAEMQKILRKRPNLQRAMDPVIVQHLIDQKRVGEAKGVLKRCATRAQEEMALHEQFSHTSFVISEGDLVLALSEARSLKEHLSHTEFEQLKAFNLLRIALLEKEVGTKKGELEAWQEVEGLGEAQLSKIEEAFHVRDVTLKDFIKHRKSVL